MNLPVTPYLFVDLRALADVRRAEERLARETLGIAPTIWGFERRESPKDPSSEALVRSVHVLYFRALETQFLLLLRKVTKGY
jgi:hypothetical protein